jgi:predicted transposase YdaD
VSRFFNLYETHRFHFRVIKLWEIPAKDLLQSGLIGLLPLIPLTQGGTEEDTLTTTAAELYVAKEYDLLALAKVIAGLRMRNKMDQETLERMFRMYQDIIQESWVYQHIIEQGMEKGLEQGIEKGMRQTLINYIEARFPVMLALAKEQTSVINDAEVLQRVTTKLFTLQTSGEVEEYLLSLGDDAVKN